MHSLVLTLIQPRTASHRIKSNPRWLVTFLVLAALSTVSFAVVHPYLVQATLQHLPSSATDSDKQVVVDTLYRDLPAKLAFHPIRLLIGWMVFSFILLYVCKAFAPQEAIRFRQMLSLEVHAEATSVIATLVAMIATVAGADSGLANVPLSVTGLFGQDQSFIINSLLASLNLFTLWQLGILTIGVSVLGGFGKLRSTLIVLLVWTLSVLFNLGAMKLLQDELHLLL